MLLRNFPEKLSKMSKVNWDCIRKGPLVGMDSKWHEAPRMQSWRGAEKQDKERRGERVGAESVLH